MDISRLASALAAISHLKTKIAEEVTREPTVEHSLRVVYLTMAQQVDRRVTRYRRHVDLLRALAPRDRPATTWPPGHFTTFKCSVAQTFGMNGECIDQGKWRIDFS